MARRLSAAEKEKGVVADNYEPPRTARVRVQAPANSSHLEKHSLTLIGRRHCSCCFKLDHELKDCLEAKAQKRTQAERDCAKGESAELRPNQPQREELRPNQNMPFRFTSSRSNAESLSTGETRYSLERRYDRRHERDNYLNSKDSRGERNNRTARGEVQRRPPRYVAPRASKEGQLNTGREGEANSRRKEHRSLSQRSHSYYREIVKPREEVRREESNSSKYQLGSSRGVPLEDKSPDHLSKEAVETAMGELRDVINIYSSCADPVESAARKERCRQAEENGEIEETAVNMVRATQATVITSPPAQGAQSLERLPATQRLSLPLSTETSQERIPATQRLSIGHQPEADQERADLRVKEGCWLARGLSRAPIQGGELPNNLNLLIARRS
ncbi:hypothetical protein HID58_006674 [Brassica napus]|uniref:Uncharacterized protein n=1 Tax=Brassica napus TaxID=3708 RepID=A0ABQ8ECR3_BRANA|nr:hypothetical protein HID58_006674 [Brassica napus]